jgi:tetratricopeptide (TPR) repeat protein
MEIVDYLLAELAQQTSGVVSIHGFSTAFRVGVPLGDEMYALNFNRERLADWPLRQIWWMTPVFYDAAQFAMPDLMSWFSPRLHLTEAVAANSKEQMMTGGTANIDDARQRAEYLIQRFEQGNQAGAPAEELLKLYLLPALESLVEVNAQKNLHDLTSRFEGFLSQIQSLDSPKLATSLDRLGRLYQSQGRYSEAEPLLQKALELRCQRLGEGHPDVSTSLNNLALLYSAQGRYTEAEPLYVRSLSIRERRLGEDHPDFATSLNNLAALYRDQGRYAEAEPLYVRSLSIREKQLGPDHPDFATSLNNLAALCRDQGRYVEAEPLFLRSLSIMERQLGADHPDVAISLNNLAGLYDTQGRYAEAEPLHVRSLEIFERQLGKDHPNVATSLNNLAVLYESQGRYAEAEPLYLEGLRILNQLSQHLEGDLPNLKTGILNFYDFLVKVISKGQQSVLSNDPIVQELIAQIQEERSHPPTPPSA